MHLLSFLLLLTSVHCYKILLAFVYPAKSHHLLGASLARQLVLRGHEVTLLSPFPSPDPHPKYKHIVLSGVKDVISEDYIRTMEDVDIGRVRKLLKFLATLENITEAVLGCKEFREVINSGEKFDLVVQQYALWASWILAYTLKAPSIAFSPNSQGTIINYMFGGSEPCSYVGTPIVPYVGVLSFKQRLVNCMVKLFLYTYYKFIHTRIQEKMLQKYFPKGPSINDLLNATDLIFINSNGMIEPAKPLLPNMVQIGGFDLYEDLEELPKGIREFLDGAHQGAIYFSFGSSLSSSNIPPNILEIFKAVFAKLQYKVIWKNGQNSTGILTSHWFPQCAILAHPNIKLFITHGGISSVSQAMFYGVPLLGFPFFFDQEYNLAHCVDRGVAKMLHLRELAPEVLEATIKELITNVTYRSTALIYSEIYRNPEIHPMDRIEHWIDHVVKHKGARHFRAVADRLPWYQYLLLDVFLVLFVGLYIAYKAGVFCIKIMVKICEKRKNRKYKIM